MKNGLSPVPGQCEGPFLYFSPSMSAKTRVAAGFDAGQGKGGKRVAAVTVAVAFVSARMEMDPSFS